MTDSEQKSQKESATRYGPTSRYEIEAGSDLESPDTTGGMKNFPTTFRPMKELEELLLSE